MVVLLKQIFALLKVLNSDTGENQVAAGIACGLVLGFAPLLSLQTILVITILFFLRVQVGAALTSSFFFALVAWVFDPAFDRVGRKVLEMDELRELFTTMYNLPIVPFTKFYNSVVMGAGVTSLILMPFVFFLSRLAIVKYRKKVLSKLENTKLWKAVKATSLYKWYAKYNELYG